MTKLTIFEPSVPIGMRIFEHNVDVAVDKRLRAAKKFAQRHRRRIFLSLDTRNTVDARAIRINGKSKGRFFENSKCIDYVPHDIADKLLRTNMDDKVKVRLHMISVDNKRSVTIRFDLFGPKDDFEKYRAVL